MINLDIVFVTYNSTKWINKNIESILKSKYDLKKVSLYYYDNASTDETAIMLNEIKNKYLNQFNDIKIILGNKNLGFGRANNKAAKLGNSNYILFLNIDTEIEEDTLKKLSEEIEKSDKSVGIFELRQKPYEHPKYYDPITGYTTWASGACMVIKRNIFEEIKGFDKNIFMYCEDVEISWHIRKKGYNIKYLYNVPITHYSYTTPNEFKETQYVFAFINNLYLRSKYGSLRNFLKGHILCLKSTMINYAWQNVTNVEYKKIAKRIRKEYLRMFFLSSFTFVKSFFSKKNSNFKPSFINDLDYEYTKLEPFYQIESKNKINEKVSIIVRTCGRPSYLRETLMSLREQTYKNIEIVIVEDGENVSEKMIKKEFSDLNIIYKSTHNKVGRSKVGNIGMELATGKYLNFLDDDDLFYPDHVEVLIKELENNNEDIVYSTAFETTIEVLSKEPYKYKIHDKHIEHHGEFSKLNADGTV